MPELPEVETIRRDLSQALLKKTIKEVEILDLPRVQPTKKLFVKKIKGLKVKEIIRVGKLLIFDLGKHQLLIHLKMTGQLVLKSKSKIVSGGHPVKGLVELPNKFTRAIFYFSNKDILYFNDVRKFGYVKLVTTEELEKIKAPYGVDPTGEEFTLKYFEDILKKSERTILKHFLLRQHPISGLGNIYVDEACFRARVQPTRILSSLTKKERKDLYQGIRRVLELSITKRGTSFNTYVGSDGERGAFYKFLDVYGRGGKLCRRCKTPIKKSRVAGRGTHYCPNCQA